MYAGCRCPRCPDAVLQGKELEGCEVLACRRCGGAFISAGVGLRLLAVLQPDVPPHDDEQPRASCPVCRASMKLVSATKASVHVDTCAKHGVWFDAGDLGPVVRAVAIAVGKPVPEVAASLEQQAAAPRPEPSTSPAGSVASAPRWSPAPTGSSSGRLPSRAPAQDDPVAATMIGAANVAAGVGRVIETPLQIVALPFQLTLATVELLTELVD